MQLDLSHTDVGDEGIIALASAIQADALPNLRDLTLSGTQLGDPGVEAIARIVERKCLRRLESLSLNGTSVTDRGIKGLSHAARSDNFDRLEHLSLDGTAVGDEGIEALAEAVGQNGLPRLRRLYLHMTQIGSKGLTCLAMAAQQHGHLQLKELSLNNTHVGHSGVAALGHTMLAGTGPHLDTLWLRDTPAMEGFPDALYNDNRPVDTLREWLNWQNAQVTGFTLNECRVLFVGESQVGKTSLCSALREVPIPQQQASTWGIDIHRFSLEEDIDGQKHTLHLWDFGGQHVMHATHCHYFSDACLYILVLDATRQAEGESLGLLQRQEEYPKVGNRISYWLRLIRRYGKYSPVIVVQTKTDGHRELALPNFEVLKATYGVNLLGTQPIDVSCLPGPAAMTSGARTDVLEKIRWALSDTAALKETEVLRSHVHSKWQRYYFEVRQDLTEALKIRGSVRRAVYDRRCKRREVPSDDRDYLLTRLHRLGELLHYRESKAHQLQNTIYDVEWVNRAIYDMLFLKDIGAPLTAAEVKARVEAQPARANSQLLSEEAWEQLLLVLREFEACWAILDEKGGLRFTIPAACPKMPRSVERHWEVDWARGVSIKCGFEADRLLHRLVARLANSVTEVETYRDGAILAMNAGGEAGMQVDCAGEAIRIAVRGNTTLRELIKLHIDQLWPMVGLSSSLNCLAAADVVVRSDVGTVDEHADEQSNSLTILKDKRRRGATVRSGEIDELGADKPIEELGANRLKVLKDFCIFYEAGKEYRDGATSMRNVAERFAKREQGQCPVDVPLGLNSVAGAFESVAEWFGKEYFKLGGPASLFIVVGGKNGTIKGLSELGKRAWRLVREYLVRT